MYDSRRSRACDACRSSKVRCEQPNPNLPCKRCAKARRECLSPTRGHKRRRSLDFNDQLTVLGGKIDHLAAALGRQPKRTPPASDANLPSAESTDRSPSVRERRISPKDSPAPGCPSPKLASTDDHVHIRRPSSFPALQPEPDVQGGDHALNIGLVSDFVETGITQIVSVRTANASYDRYCAELSVIFPAVVLDPAASATEVRSAKPVVFLAILAAASGAVCDMDTQRRLRCLLTIVLAHCFANKSEYGLDLVQAMIVSALWQTPSDLNFGQEPMDVQQLSHAAANVAIHIGLCKQPSARSRDPSARRDGQNPQLSKSCLAADLEARRTWLGCYFICANASMPSQQPTSLCWNQYMDECIEVLETSASALPLDEYFCKHIRLQRATEEHSRKVFARHLFRSASTPRPKTHEIPDSFKREFTIPDDSPLGSTSIGIIRLLYYSSTLYINELIAVTDGGVNPIGSKPDLTRVVPTRQCSTSSSRYSMFRFECVLSARKVILLFTSLDLQSIRCMPTIFLIRVIHAMIFLVNSSLCTSHDDITRGSSLDGDKTKLGDQLDDMIETMANWRSEWPACKLIQIFVRLRRQLQDNRDKVTDSATCTSSSHNSYTSHHDQDTQTSISTLPSPPTPSNYQSLGQQAFHLKPAYVSGQENMSFGDSSLWDDLFEPLAPYKRITTPSLTDPYIWKAQQPQPQIQQHSMLSERAFSSDNVPPTRPPANHSDSPDLAFLVSPLLSMGDMLAS